MGADEDSGLRHCPQQRIEDFSSLPVVQWVHPDEDGVDGE